MDRGLELWTHKEITSTLTVPGTVRTAVGRDRWIRNTLESQYEETCKQGWLFLKTEHV